MGFSLLLNDAQLFFFGYTTPAVSSPTLAIASLPWLEQLRGKVSEAALDRVVITATVLCVAVPHSPTDDPGIHVFLFTHQSAAVVRHWSHLPRRRRGHGICHGTHLSLTRVGHLAQAQLLALVPSWGTGPSLPQWSGRETHVVLRSGATGLEH